MARRLTAAEQYCLLADIVASNGMPSQSVVEALDPLQFAAGEARLFLTRVLAGDDPVDLLSLVSPSFRARLFPDAPDTQEVLAAQLAERWSILGIEDLLQPPSRPEYLIDGMLRKPSLSCWYGAPGDLKSMLLMDLAVCVASGQDWLAPLPNVSQGGGFSVQQGPVLWLDMDNGPDRLKERFGALCRARGITNAPIHAISLPRPIFDAGKPDEADLLAAQMKRLGAVLLVVDNLATVCGGRDENTSEMVVVLTNLAWVARSTRSAGGVIHHSRKASGFGGGRRGDSLRGHSSIEAAFDLAIQLERTSDDLSIGSTKTRDDPVSPMVARWTWEVNADGALEAARFWHLQDLIPERPDYMDAAEETTEILGGMTEAPSENVLCRALKARCDLGKRKAQQAIGYALENGWIRETRDGTGSTSPKRYGAS